MSSNVNKYELQPMRFAANNEGVAELVEKIFEQAQVHIDEWIAKDRPLWENKEIHLYDDVFVVIPELESTSSGKSLEVDSLSVADIYAATERLKQNFQRLFENRDFTKNGFKEGVRVELSIDLCEVQNRRRVSYLKIATTVSTEA